MCLQQIEYRYDVQIYMQGRIAQHRCNQLNLWLRSLLTRFHPQKALRNTQCSSQKLMVLIYLSRLTFSFSKNQKLWDVYTKPDFISFQIFLGLLASKQFAAVTSAYQIPAIWKREGSALSQMEWCFRSGVNHIVAQQPSVTGSCQGPPIIPNHSVQVSLWLLAAKKLLTPPYSLPSVYTHKAHWVCFMETVALQLCPQGWSSL